MPDNELEALLADPDPCEAERLAVLSALFPHMEKELQRTGVTRFAGMVVSISGFYN